MIMSSLSKAGCQASSAASALTSCLFQEVCHSLVLRPKLRREVVTVVDALGAYHMPGRGQLTLNILQHRHAAHERIG